MTTTTRLIGRRTLLGTLAALPVGAAQAADPVTIGVSGPLTGQYAQYGADWRRGFDLVIAEINGSGGIAGRPLAYRFEDSQSDRGKASPSPRNSSPTRRSQPNSATSPPPPPWPPRRSTSATTSSSSASPTPTRTSPRPAITCGATPPTRPTTCPSSPPTPPSSASSPHRRSATSTAIGAAPAKTCSASAAPTREGATIAATESYLPNEQDFRSLLVRLRDAKPDGLVLVSYYPDGALLVRQARDIGLAVPIVAAGSVYSPKFLELAGPAADGVYTNTNFFPADPRPAVQRFVSPPTEPPTPATPGFYAARGYDAMMLLATVMRQFGTGRTEIPRRPRQRQRRAERPLRHRPVRPRDPARAAPRQHRPRRARRRLRALGRQTGNFGMKETKR